MVTNKSHNLAATTSVFGMVWPDNVIRQFQMVPKYPQQNDFHGPYNKLLNTLFPADSEYTVIPPFPEPGSSQASDWIVTTDVFLVDKPILILQLKKPGDLDLVSARELTDFQIRQRMADLRGKLWVPFYFCEQLLNTMDLNQPTVLSRRCMLSARWEQLFVFIL